MHSPFRIILLLAVACCIYAIAMIAKMCPTVLAVDIQQDLSIPLTSLSFISSSTILVSALMGIPAGVLSDRIGPRSTLVFLLFCIGVGMALFSIAGFLGIAVLGRIIVGVGVSVLPPLLALVARWVSPQAFGIASSVLMTAGNLGIVLAMAPLAYGSQTIGWRASVMWVAIVGFILAAASFILFRTANSTTGEKKEKQSQPPVLASLLALIKNKHILMIVIWMNVTPGLIIAFASLWWGPYLIQGAGIPQQSAGNVLSVITLSNSIALIVFAWLSERVFHSRKKLIIASSLICIAGILGLILASDIPNAYLHMAIGICFYVGSGGAVSVAIASTTEDAPANLRGTATGIVYMSITFGGTIIQVIFGFIVAPLLKTYPAPAAYSYGLGLFLAAAIIGLICTFFMKETFPKEQPASR